MLNFLRRDQRKLPISVLTAWTLSSALVPWIIPGLFALLIAGAAAALGGSFTVALFEFVSDISGDWLHLTVQLWLTSYLMMAVFYGVGRELIGRTLKNPITAPLAMLADRIMNRVCCRTLTLPLPATAGSPDSGFPQSLAPDPVINAPPAALLTGAAPLLE